ncbi:MAG: hypothetical protein QXM43_10295 [Desulfurococcaceae archaeon]
MSLVIFTGSVASGKTTVARTLKNIIANKGLAVKYIDININHGFTYLLTRFLNVLLKYTYVGNHYLTIRFNNEILFCKYLQIMQLLDAIYTPIKYLTGLKIFIILNRLKRRKYVILLDEYYLNAIVDYLYFSERLCKQSHEQNSYTKNTFRVFYVLAYHLIIRTIKSHKTLIVYMNRFPRDSINGWLHRERTNIVDVNQIIFRRLATKVLLNIFRQQNNIYVFIKEYSVRDFPKSLVSIIYDVLKFIGGTF